MKVINQLENSSFVKFLNSDWQKATFLHHTGNMFGLGCSAFNGEAVAKVNRLKKRSQNKGYIVLMPDSTWLERYGIKHDKKYRRLIEQYWPGNLTIVMKDSDNSFDKVAFNGAVGLRIPAQPFLREFLYRIDTPLLSTSVNLSGEIPLMQYDDIVRQKKNWFDYAVIPHDIHDVTPLPSTIIGITGDEITYLREGSIDFDEIKRSYDFPLILFVCTGNICRSPMAEYYTKKLMIDKKLPFRIESAGFLDNDIKISKHSYDLLKEYGINSSLHLSRKINRKIIQQSWLILTMEEIHKKSIIEIDPAAVDKVHTFSEYCGKEYCLPSSDIEDPYGLEIYFYREAFKKIKERAECLAEKLIREDK